uniref:hypothetical protein n=1 Tax=Promineifilum sp. TaxID=2664178 RepID=UPI0035B147FE
AIDCRSAACAGVGQDGDGWPAVGPNITATPPPTPRPAATTVSSSGLPTDPAALVNGLPVERFAILPPDVAENVRTIFARGQALGRDPRAFAKMGDSISLSEHYFARFDWGGYNLGIYTKLQPAIDYYRGSFARVSQAVRSGARAGDALRPGLGDAALCRADEHRLACEFRLHNPSVVLIRVGTNDLAPGDAFEPALRQSIAYSIEQGVIPVIVTKADRSEGSNRHNETMRALAAEYAIPLWDYDAAAATLPNRGLSGDSIHLTMYAEDDYTDPAALTFGYPLSDLTGLFMLDAIRRTVAGEEAQ